MYQVQILFIHLSSHFELKLGQASTFDLSKYIILVMPIIKTKPKDSQQPPQCSLIRTIISIFSLLSIK